MKSYIIFVFVFLSYSVFCQSPLIKLQDKLTGLTADTTYRKLGPEQIKSINAFWAIFKDIRNKEINLDRLKGSAAFGYLGNNNEDTEIFRINGGISLKKGSYPQDFEFSTQLNIVIDDGQLEENLSNLRISYDRFFGGKNPFLFEGYSFINRRSDAWLGVNQRYEIGAGIIAAHWGKKLLGASKTQYEKYSSEQVSFKSENGRVIICDIKNCVPIEARGIGESDFDVLNTSQTRIANSIIKNKSPLRIGVLIGAFFEVESISHSDTLLTNEGKKYFSHDFNSTNNFRWELRPTFDFKVSDGVKFRIRPFFKLPMPWEWEVEVDDKKEIDARFELPLSLSINLSDQFSFSAIYTLFYDNAPNSLFLGNIGANDEPLFLTANKRHNFYNFYVNYRFK